MKQKISKILARRRVWSLPYVLFMAVFIVMPLLLIMFYAFQTKNGGFSMENFERFINQPEAANTFIYSIGIALITTIICLVLGYPAAYVLTKLKPSNARLMVMPYMSIPTMCGRTSMRWVSRFRQRESLSRS